MEEEKCSCDTRLKSKMLSIIIYTYYDAAQMHLLISTEYVGKLLLLSTMNLILGIQEHARTVNYPPQGLEKRGVARVKI